MASRELEVGEWRYSLTDTTQDKRSRRTGTPPQASRELVGFDGRVDGALRPISGFKKAYTLQQGDVVEPGDFFPVTLRRGHDEVLSGFVYRFKNTGSGHYGIAFDYYRNGSWTSQVLISAGADVGNSPMDVMEFGRFCYILRKGQEPFLMYASTVDPFTLNMVDDTGPGPRPVLYAPDRNPAALGGFSEGVNGQIVLTATPPSQTMLWATEVQADDEVRKIDAGDYAFAFMWYNSVTGRKSSVSEIVPAKYAMFGETVTTIIEDADGSGPGTASGELIETEYMPRYAIFEGVVDLAKYDQVYLFRSVRIQDAGGTFVASILGLDGIYDCQEYTTSSQTGVGPDVGPTQYRRIAIYYRLEDKQLVFTDWYLDRVLFDEEMPFAGAGIVHEGTGILGNIEDEAAEDAGPLRSVGEIRWSALLEISPELYPPTNRYVPRNPTDQVIRFVSLGGEVMGFSQNRIYFIRKEGGYLKIIETHDGFGAVSKMAVESVGSFIYFLNHGGLKAVDIQGQLDDVRAINDPVINEWGPEGLTNCSLAFDDEAQCLFVLNPDALDGHGVAVCFWMTTAKVSEIHDATFNNVRRGHLPNGDFATRRALFCDEFGAVYTLDIHREKTISGVATFGDIGMPRLCTLDIDNNLILTVASVADSGGLYTRVTVEAVTGGVPLPADANGAWVYVLGGPRNGNSARMTNADAWNSSRFSTEIGFDVEAGDIIVISPIICQWVGPQLGLVDDTGQPFAGTDHFRARHLSSLGCAFADVTGATAALPYATYEGLVYVGNNADPAARAFPDTDPDYTEIRTIIDGPTRQYASLGNPSSATHTKFGVTNPSLYPGVRILVSDFDFALLGVQAKGKIEATDTTKRNP